MYDVKNLDDLGAPAPTPTWDTPLGWQEFGLCRGADQAVFFPGRGESVKAAKEACFRCPVREVCLDYALTNGEMHGIWGGMSERERRRERRARGITKVRTFDVDEFLKEAVA